MDLVEQRFWREIWDTAETDAAAGGLQRREFGPVQVTAIAALPEARWLNLVLGAHSEGAVVDGHLAAAIDWVGGLGVDYYVPVAPGAPGAGAAEAWLRGAGFERGYGWMKFTRPAGAPLPEATAEGLELNELEAGEGADFGAIAAVGFGLPEWAASLFTGLPGRPGWRCYLAKIDGRAVACAAMLIEGGLAELGIAATLEAARGRGCQSALLRRRIEDAEAAGCRGMFVETGERDPERPSASYRNILRAGFEEAYLRPNWQRP